MIALRVTLVILLAVAVGPSLAQSRGGPAERGSTPPGISQDGSGPSEGAIEGGSSLRGGTGDNPGGAESAVNRCRELKGALREQCLRDIDASAGRPRAPQTPSSPPIGRDPVTDPPPQNPR
jgi:hypothetical protein